MMYLIQYQDSIINEATLIERIREQGKHIYILKNTWLVASPKNAKEIYETISLGYEKNNLIVLQVFDNNYWGLMSTLVWDWIKENSSKK